MKTVTVLLAAIVAILVSAASATAAETPPQDSVRAHFTEPDGRRIEVNAHSNSDGTNPWGHITVNFHPDEKVIEHFEVTCVAVLGNRATVIGELKQVSPPRFSTAVTGVVVWVTDNEALGVPDQYAYNLVPPPAVCQPITFPLFPLPNGNIDVRDAS